jgi:hypothetical protein
MRLIRLTTAVALFAAAALIATGCTQQYGATGIVIAAQGPDSASVTNFTLRTYDGKTLQFKVGVLDLNNGLPAPHLREHLVNGVPIFVTYHMDNGANVATRYVDVTVPASASP